MAGLVCFDTHGGIATRCGKRALWPGFYGISGGEWAASAEALSIGFSLCERRSKSPREVALPPRCCRCTTSGEGRDAGSAFAALA